jgi:hypothetical protein
VPNHYYLDALVRYRNLRFSKAINFHGDIGHWDVSTVITLERTFKNATRFTGQGKGGGLKLWSDRVRQVRNFFETFANTPAFDADISRWRVDSAHTMERMLYNATAIGRTHPMKATTTERHDDASGIGFKLLCWNLPSSTVKVENMMCGSNVRFDPCCVTPTQLQASCCNRFCYNTSTVCSDPARDQSQKSHYEAASWTMAHEDYEEYRRDNDNGDDKYSNDDMNTFDFGIQKQGIDVRAKQKLGAAAIVFIIVLVIAILMCFVGLVYYL